MDHGREGARITPRPPGVLEALIAAALGGGALPAVVIAWERLFHSQAPEWVKGSLPNLLAFIVLTPALWLLTKSIAWARTRNIGQTALAKGNRLSIYVARLGDDEISSTARASVIDSIRRELGSERVEVLPAGIQLALKEVASLDDAADDAAHKARSLLKKKHGDLLIWGQVHTLPAKEPVIELRFVSASQDGESQRFGFTDMLMLDPGFGPELGAALAAVAGALAAPAIRDEGKYVLRMLVPVANRLAPLARNLPPSMRVNDRGTVLSSYGLLQWVIGEQSDQSAALEEAVSALRSAVKERTRERAPLDWARTQDHLGIALCSLGDRETGTARLEEAVAAHLEALKELTRERAPVSWAATQNNLGNALCSLGNRETGTARLEEAIAAYREALKERTRERVPLDWAATQNNLGYALSSWGDREDGMAQLEEAVTACREALKVLTRERAPLNWAKTQNNLGIALCRLGNREIGTARLEEAVAAHLEALKELTRERAPVNWAATQNILGAALCSLGDRETGTARLEAAIAAFREALKERTRERVPLGWAATQNGLGFALQCLGQRETGTERLSEAIEAYREALMEYRRERVPLDCAATQTSLGIALFHLGNRETGTARLEEAVAAYREALEILDNTSAPSQLRSLAASGKKQAELMVSIKKGTFRASIA